MKNFLGAKFRTFLKIFDRPWGYPVVLLCVGLAAYGIIFSHPGFFWDDWGKVYLYYTHNMDVSLHYSPSRPFTVWTYLFLFTFAKMTPLVWQIVVLVLRWLGILFIYFTLNALWPRRVWQHRWIGVLMFVFPGFISQPVSVAYSDQFMVFLVFACSLFLTVLALKSNRLFWLWMPLSVVLGIAQIFLIEYFVLLEVIRPIVIWFILRSQGVEKKKALRKTVIYWLPFVLGLAAFLVWRLFFIPESLGSDPNSVELLKIISRSPISGLKTLIEMALQDIVRLLTTVWATPFAFDRFNILHSLITRISWAVGILAAILTGLYIHFSAREESPAGTSSLAQVMLLGVVALLAGAFPVWATDRFIIAGKWSDRFTLGPMLGTVILFVTILDWLFRTRNQKQWLFVILLAASISLQICNSNKFRVDWVYQQNMYWQMSWRIPELKPGTAIIGSGTFTDKSSTYEGGFVINLLFSDKLGKNAEYDYFDVWHLPWGDYEKDLTFTDKLQGSRFSGNSSQVVGMFFDSSDPNGCIRILDPVYKWDPVLDKTISKIIPISDLGNILVDGRSMPPNPAIFGEEVPHRWCFFFEKADLARQKQDWDTIVNLVDEAKTAGFFVPTAGGEYLPFIEAYAQTGQWTNAHDLSLAALQVTPGLEPMLCNNWERFQSIPGGKGKDTNLAKAQAEFCLEVAKK